MPKNILYPLRIYRKFQLSVNSGTNGYVPLLLSGCVTFHTYNKKTCIKIWNAAFCLEILIDKLDMIWTWWRRCGRGWWGLGGVWFMWGSSSACLCACWGRVYSTLTYSFLKSSLHRTISAPAMPYSVHTPYPPCSSHALQRPYPPCSRRLRKQLKMLTLRVQTTTKWSLPDGLAPCRFPGLWSTNRWLAFQPEGHIRTGSLPPSFAWGWRRWRRRGLPGRVQEHTEPSTLEVSAHASTHRSPDVPSSTCLSCPRRTWTTFTCILWTLLDILCIGNVWVIPAERSVLVIWWLPLDWYLALVWERQVALSTHAHHTNGNLTVLTSSSV